MDLSDVIVPVAGATRIETAHSLARAAGIVFDGRRSRAARRAVPGRPERCGRERRPATQRRATDATARSS